MMVSGCIPQEAIQNFDPEARPDLLLTLMGHLALGGFDEAIFRLWSFNQDLLLPYAHGRLLAVRIAAAP